MNWQKVSIERLREYETRKQSLTLISEQIQTLEMKLTALKASGADEACVKGGGDNKREDSIVNNITLRQELKRNYKIAKREVKITEKGLAGLTDEQKKILHKFYICRTDNYIDELCEELCFERSRLYEMKNEALKKFTLSCYGVIET